MRLINVRGESLAVPARVWQAALAAAQSHGWTPRRTRRPAISIEGQGGAEWNGDYFPPLGQEVTRGDAVSLAEVLSVAAAEHNGLRGSIEDIAAFSARGAFILCNGDAPESSGLLNLLHATGAAAETGLRETVAVRAENKTV